MYRALPASRRVASPSTRPSFKVLRRRLATEAAEAVPPKKRSVVKRLFWITTAATGTFYVGSTFVAFNNQPYYEFFSDNVPLGRPMLEYAETHKWDTLTIEDVIEATKNGAVAVQHLTTDLINKTPGAREAVDTAKAATEKKIEEAKASTLKAIRTTKAKVEPVIEQVKAEVRDDVNKVTHKVEALVRHQNEQVSDELTELIRRAEAALADKPYVPDSVESTRKPPVPETPSEAPPQISSPPTESPVAPEKPVYGVPLPIGFEPPPGFIRPSPPAPKPEEVPQAPESQPQTQVTLPLVAPAISSLSASEPIVTHLAGTIDNLASFLEANPAAAEKATGVLENAKADLASLVERIEKVKEEERSALELKLDEQAREHTLKLLELEMEAQDKLDSQEEGFRNFFEEERAKFLQAYWSKLDQELKTQTELINERLKEEVIAQGIELQRRWIREVKVHVEEERGGRLAKLDELAADLKRLERLALDNTNYLDENIRVHALWSAVRALSSTALGSSTRQSFREQLRVLRHVAAAREDPVISATLATLDGSDTPDIGIEPFSDLASWFTTSVAPKVSEVALVPDENAGILSYLASKALSGIRFKKQGLVAGSDVLSVLSRAEYYLNEKDLDSATRELNQLQGPAKVLLHDWLEAARRRLEVQQALEVIQTEATLSSLLVI